MKVNRNTLIAQEDAFRECLQDLSILALSPFRYGLLFSGNNLEKNFEVRIALEQRDSVAVHVNCCQAITCGGVRIDIPFGFENNPVQSLPVPPQALSGNTCLWVILICHPFERVPAGNPDPLENPPRFPSVLPAYSIQLIIEQQLNQYTGNPYALIIGKLPVKNGEIQVDAAYIPPSFCLGAHPALVSFFSRMDEFLARMESLCIQIIQKIFQKNQHNSLSELVHFLCDRLLLHLPGFISDMHGYLLYESPVLIFSRISALARVVKNTVDLRAGTGKDELLNYFSEWSDLRQGELDNILNQMIHLKYDPADIRSSIQVADTFTRAAKGLFETLHELEFIGKRRESGIFVKEELSYPEKPVTKTRRSFLG